MKSYKLKNGNYIDSIGIVHNKELLSEILDKNEIISSPDFPVESTETALHGLITNLSRTINVDGSEISVTKTRFQGIAIISDNGLVQLEIGVFTYSSNSSINGKMAYRFKHGNFGSDKFITIN